MCNPRWVVPQFVPEESEYTDAEAMNAAWRLLKMELGEDDEYTDDERRMGAGKRVTG